MFAHVSVRARDMEKSISFHGGFLGMKLISKRAIEQNNAEIAFLQSDGSNFRLELTCYKDQGKFIQTCYKKRVFDHLAFIVDDLGGLIGEMRGKGVTITDEPSDMGSSQIAFVEGACGALIELIQRR